MIQDEVARRERKDLFELGHKMWFVVDELDALGPIDGLKDALARLRKFGGGRVLGLQSIAQVRGTSGDAEAQTIVENCGTTLILRCSASERGGTAEFHCMKLGRAQPEDSRIAKKSIHPIITTNTDAIKPMANSQADMFAPCIAAVCQ